MESEREFPLLHWNMHTEDPARAGLVVLRPVSKGEGLQGERAGAATHGPVEVCPARSIIARSKIVLEYACGLWRTGIHAHICLRLRLVRPSNMTESFRVRPLVRQGFRQRCVTQVNMLPLFNIMDSSGWNMLRDGRPVPPCRQTCRHDHDRPFGRPFGQSVAKS